MQHLSLNFKPNGRTGESQMKKKMIALLAAAMMTLAAGNAFADFANTDLIRVVYNAAGNIETATDLGAISTLLTVTNDNITANPFTNAISTASGSVVAYYAENSAASAFYVSTNGAVTVNGGKTAGLNGAITNANLTYASKGTPGYATTALTSGGINVPNTYFLGMDAATTVNAGTMAGLIVSGSGSAEASLASLTLGNGNTNVQQSLYLLTSPGRGNGTAVQQTTAGYGNLVIQTNGDGTTTINPNAPSATPIPPAFFLMGSGLLGMFGLGRKKRA
jgi:hypothetical protein